MCNLVLLSMDFISYLWYLSVLYPKEILLGMLLKHGFWTIKCIFTGCAVFVLFGPERVIEEEKLILP